MSEQWHRWGKRDFLTLPEQPFTKEITWWRELLFAPARRLHETGYNTITFIGVDNDGPKLQLGRYDVLNLNGDAYWSMDCLYPSGVFRLWRSGHDIAWDWGSILTQRRIAVNA